MSALQLAPGPLEARPGARIALSIERRLAAFTKSAAAAREGGDEAIHDLRVAARRLAAALELWRDALARRPRRRATRRLRRLRRALGPARNAEVHRAELGRRALDPALRLALAELLDRLDRSVARGRARAVRLGAERRIEGIARRVRRAAQAVAARAPHGIAGARARLPVAGARARAALHEALASGDDEALHGARIAIKKWRYALEAGLDGGVLAAGVPPLERLRAAQQALGKVQDCVTLRARLVRYERRQRERGVGAALDAVPGLIAELDAERERAIVTLRALAPSLEPQPV